MKFKIVENGYFIHFFVEVRPIKNNWTGELLGYKAYVPEIEAITGKAVYGVGDTQRDAVQALEEKLNKLKLNTFYPSTYKSEFDSN